MTVRRWRLWLPRALVLLFACSLLLPAPGLITGMGRDALIVWAARLLWVLGLIFFSCCLLISIAVVRRCRGKKP